jgi:hypothetical protein
LCNGIARRLHQQAHCSLEFGPFVSIFNIKIRPMHQAKDHPYFLTATCLEWKHLLADDRMKEMHCDVMN